MPIASTAPCPHCAAAGSIVNTYCEACGKALPWQLPKTPQVVARNAMPQTPAGRRLVEGELASTARASSYGLLVAGIIRGVIGTIIILVVVNSSRVRIPALQVQLAILSTAGTGAILIGLYIWSRRSPLAANVTGLVVYGTVVALTVTFTAIEAARAGNRGETMNPLGISWLDIVVLVLLVQGISASLRARKMAAADV